VAIRPLAHHINKTQLAVKPVFTTMSIVKLKTCN